MIHIFSLWWRTTTGGVHGTVFEQLSEQLIYKSTVTGFSKPCADERKSRDTCLTNKTGRV